MGQGWEGNAWDGMVVYGMGYLHDTGQTWLDWARTQDTAALEINVATRPHIHTHTYIYI